MADGHVVQGSSPNMRKNDICSSKLANSLAAIVDDSPHYISWSLNAENMSVKYSKFLKFDGNFYRWVGDFNDLRSYFDEVLDLTGRWSSPSGDVKLFTAINDEFSVKWQRSKKLVILRDNPDKYLLKSFESLIEFDSDDRVNSSVEVESQQATLLSKIDELAATCNNKFDRIFEHLANLKPCCPGSSDTVLINSNLQEENSSLRNANINLKEELNSLNCIVFDLNSRIKCLEEEKSSLLTAIRLIQIENNCASNHSSNGSSINDSDPKSTTVNENKDSSVLFVEDTLSSPKAKKLKRKYKKKKSLSTIRGKNHLQEIHAVNPSNTISNSNDPAGQSDQSFNIRSGVENNQTAQPDLQVTESNKVPNEMPTTDHVNEGLLTNNRSKVQGKNNQSQNKKDRKSVVIAGDSMIQHVHGWEMSNSEVSVAVKSFSGAKIDDMADFLQPVIRRSPDNIILHIGTNNIKDKDSPDVLAAGISNLASMIIKKSPSTKVAISSLIVRRDRNLSMKIKSVNKLLLSTCAANNWQFINNANLDESCLNQRGLHLNRKGSGILSRNFSNII